MPPSTAPCPFPEQLPTIRHLQCGRDNEEQGHRYPHRIDLEGVLRKKCDCFSDVVKKSIFGVPKTPCQNKTKKTGTSRQPATRTSCRQFVIIAEGVFLWKQKGFGRTPFV
jgi:hypothetical protein